MGLAGNTVAEDAAVGAVIGSLSATDVDLGETFAYSIVSGAFFAIDGSNVVVAFGLDFETVPSHQVNVRVIDSANNAFDKEFTINVTDVNEDPTGIDLSGTAAVAENSAAGPVVGSVTPSDPDAGDTLSYAITGGNTGGAFTIDAAGQITVANPGALDLETTPVFTLTVQVQDQAGTGLTATDKTGASATSPPYGSAWA